MPTTAVRTADDDDDGGNRQDGGHPASPSTALQPAGTSGEAVTVASHSLQAEARRHLRRHLRTLDEIATRPARNASASVAAIKTLADLAGVTGGRSIDHSLLERLAVAVADVVEDPAMLDRIRSAWTSILASYTDSTT